MRNRLLHVRIIGGERSHGNVDEGNSSVGVADHVFETVQSP